MNRTCVLQTQPPEKPAVLSPVRAVRPGAPCLACLRGKFTVYSSKNRGLLCVQYLRCNACGHRPANHRRVIGRRKRRTASPKNSGCQRCTSCCGGCHGQA